MSIKNKYQFAGVLAGVSMGLMSFVITLPVTFAIFGIFLFGSQNAFIPIIGIPIIISFVILFTSYIIGKKQGEKAEEDLENLDINKKKAQKVIFMSGAFLIIGIIIFILGLFRLYGFADGVREKAEEGFKESRQISEKYKEYAKIGDVRFELGEPYGENEITNPYPERGPFYKRIDFIVPISVSKAGEYEIYFKYDKSSKSETVNKKFEEGEHEVSFSYEAHELSYSSWAPDLLGSTAKVELSYLASLEEVDRDIEKLDLEQSLLKKVTDQFLKDEGLKSDGPIKKFIENKVVDFYKDEKIETSGQVGGTNNVSNTLGWKTFKSDEYMFEFQYPNDWRVEKFSSQFLVCKKDIICTIYPDALSATFVINIYDNSEGLNVHQYTSEEARGAEVVGFSNLAGEEAVITVPKNVDWGQYKGEYLWVSKAEFIYNFVAGFEERVDILEEFSDILSTFKFIDPPIFDGGDCC